MKKFATYMFLFWGFTLQAYGAQTDTNRTITKLAVQNDDRGYFRAVEGFTLGCKYSVVYFDVATPSGKGYLSLLMAAKMASKAVSITYDIDVSNVCTITHVTIE